jgi:ABC-type transport system involved in cytochrome bd biosynthesis fused ATPase/permease subunit
MRVTIITPWLNRIDLLPVYEAAVDTADEIIVLESGQLPERGPLAELVNDDGVFNRLWERQ